MERLREAVLAFAVSLGRDVTNRALVFDEAVDISIVSDAEQNSARPARHAPDWRSGRAGLAALVHRRACESWS